MIEGEMRMGMYGYWSDTIEKVCDEYVLGRIAREVAEKRLVSMGVCDADEWLDEAMRQHKEENGQFGVGA